MDTEKQMEQGYVVRFEHFESTLLLICSVFAYNIQQLITVVLRYIRNL